MDLFFFFVATSNVFSYIGAVVNYVVVAFPIFFVESNIEVTAAYVSQASFASVMLISGFSTFLNLGSSLTDLGGFTNRIAGSILILQDLYFYIYIFKNQNVEMMEIMDEMQPQIESNLVTNKSNDNQIVVDDHQDSLFSGEFKIQNFIEFDDVSLFTPLGSRLISS